MTLPAGPQVLIAVADGYGRHMVPVYHSGPIEQNIRLHPASFIEGEVRDKGSDSPVAEARIVIFPNKSSGEGIVVASNAAGRFESPALSPGEYVVSAFRDNLAGTTSAPIHIAGTERQKTVLWIDEGKVLTGRVTTMEDEPVVEAQKQCSHQALPVRADQ
jgi:hypothetical protein